MSVAFEAARMPAPRGRRDEMVRNSEVPEGRDKEKGHHSRNSALTGQVDYVDFAERVSQGVTVEPKPIPKRREPR
jgi:hypothetical protein